MLTVLSSTQSLTSGLCGQEEQAHQEQQGRHPQVQQQPQEERRLRRREVQQLEPPDV